MTQAPDTLRSYVERLIGWSNSVAIDQALRSIELARNHRAQLVICGNGDLVPIAYRLHRRVFGEAAPFVVCDPHRGNTRASVRGPANYLDVDAAFDAALGGSLCIRRGRPPRRFPVLIDRLRGTDDVQYICLGRDALDWLVRPGPIAIPSLRDRIDELPRIISESVADALLDIARQEVPSLLSDSDWRWLLARAPRLSFGELEKAITRIVALRSLPSVTRAASQLGMRPVSLARWMRRRKLATGSVMTSLP